MLTLPSGEIVTLAAVPFDPPPDLGKARLRRHLLACATEVQDLYPLLDVVRFVRSEDTCKTTKCQEFFSEPPQDSGLRPETARQSLLEFDDSLDATSKDALDAWISSDAVRAWIAGQLQAIVLQRFRNPQRQLYRLPPKKTAEVPRLSPPDIAISSASLFPDETKDWQAYASDCGILRLRPKLFSWGPGVWGSLALGNPPSDQDIDAWEASKPAGVWDYYEFLSFMTTPPMLSKQSSLVLCFAPSTFFYRTGEVIASVPLTEKFSNVFETEWLDGSDFLSTAWQHLVAVLGNHYQLAVLSEQVWTLNGRSFTAADPDQ
jgi:hypothetical protein